MASPGAPEGNQNARKENRLWGEAVRRAVVQGNAERLRALADKLVDLALAGDVTALKELGDRLDGKSRQQLEVSGEDGGPMRILHESK